MPELLLIPIISVFDVHDAAVRDWLGKLDEESVSCHLESPYRLDRFFPESARHAMKSVEKVHTEVLHLLDVIDPQAVLLDITVDFIDLENRYNKRLLSPSEFWAEYHETEAHADGSKHTVYCIYIKGVIDRLSRLIENREKLPLSVVFYGLDIKTRDELIPVYEDAFNEVSDFILHLARELNEIMNLRESPEKLWYSAMTDRQTAISYEETEKFYTELLYRINRLLKFKAREYFVRSLWKRAVEFRSAYEKFLDYKIREEEIKFSNILEGLSILSVQSDLKAIVILCGPMHYFAILNSLRKEKRLHEMGMTFRGMEIQKLLNEMKPFTQKYRIMQSSYDIALDILSGKKPLRFKVPDTIIVPS